MRWWFALVTLVVATGASAQSVPILDPENPRLQTVRWVEGQEVLLTAMPSSGLTVLLEPGEQIERVVIDNEQSLEVRVSAERDSLLLLPLRPIDNSRVFVTTDRRTYPLVIRTNTGLTSAYLVRFMFAEADPLLVEALETAPSGKIWSYRLRGDREVRPQSIRDDERQTFITYTSGQSLPAVFAIGPTGEEEVVNGYIRQGAYVIDRVYSELVFRIDKERATARRNSEPDETG